MSAKHYEYRVVEVTELAEMERQLTALGSDGWAAVGYGVLPSGQRSVLLSRKQDKRKRDRHGHDRPHEREAVTAASEHVAAADRVGP